MTVTTDLPPLMTTNEVAAFFRVTPRTIRNWVRKGDLISIKKGRVTRFRREDVAVNAGQVNDENGGRDGKYFVCLERSL